MDATAEQQATLGSPEGSVEVAAMALVMEGGEILLGGGAGGWMAGHGGGKVRPTLRHVVEQMDLALLH